MILAVELHSLLRWVVLGALAAGASAGLVAAAIPSLPRRPVRWVLAGAVAAVDVQVVLGALIWLGQSAWAAHGPFVAYVHPAAMLVALGAVHLGAARGGRGGRRDLLVATGAILGAALLVVVAVPGGPDR